MSKLKPTYTARAMREDLPCEAVVLHCSDNRFQVTFNEFLTSALGLRSYVLIAIPGGAHFVPLEAYLPKFAKTGFQSLSFMVKRAKPRRVILVGHDDCLFFKERLQFFSVEADFNQRQLVNLIKARSILADKYAGLAVELYFADVGADRSVKFANVG